MAEKESDEGVGAGGRQRRPHDSAYKYLFSSRRVVHQFLTRFIDEQFTRGLTPDDVRRFESSFVSDEFLSRESDVIYTIRTGGREVYLYVLIEFQSTVDKAIPVRMLHYICGLYDQLLRGSSAGLLPAVFPVLLYNGGERWTVPGNVRELIEGSIPSRYIPSFEYYPVIEHDIPDETLERVRGLVAAVVYLEKRRDADSLAGAVDAVIGMLEQERPEELRLFTRWLNRMFRHAFSAGEIERIRELRGVKSMLSEVVDQIIERGKEEGLEQGLRQKARETARRMLAKGYAIDDVVDVTGLEVAEVRLLAESSDSGRE